MYLLAIDTATPKRFSIAIIQNGTILSEYRSPAGMRGSDTLIPSLDRLLKKNKLQIENMQAYAIAQGPGSFTGLRVGYAILKGFCLVDQRPVYTIPTLEVIAYQVRHCVGRVCVMIDAKQNRLYSAVYDIDTQARIRTHISSRIVHIDEMLALLQGKVYFVGDGIALYRQRLQSASHITPIMLPSKYWTSSAGAVGLCASQKLQKTKGYQGARILPLYLYPKECTIKHVP